jgi:ornithine carbamoyltransferase
MSTLRHLLDITDLAAEEVQVILDMAERPTLGRPLDGRGAALIFEKPSNRTRHSTEMAVVQLGGHPIYTRGDEIGLDVREPVEDIAAVMSGYHGVIAARVFDHTVAVRLAGASDVPVLNLLSDHSHPLQGLADALTMRQALGSLAGRTVAYVGDFNNVARSLVQVAALSRMHVRLGCPPGYDAPDEVLAHLSALGALSVEQHPGAADAVVGADVVHTDTWISMGQEDEKTERMSVFENFTVDETMMRRAADGATFMHCLPAYRGLEVTADVIDGPRSRVIPQAHNRMHAARAAIAFVLGVR